MKILLFGKNGQIGWELRRSLSPLGELISLGSNDISPSGDLADLSGLSSTVQAIEPDVIVNAAAYTAVDRAETEPTLSRLINARAPGVLADCANRLDALLVHYSTDYVYAGTGARPWQEDDPVQPCNAYGQTKAEGDRAIQTSGCRHLIFRTSWVYAPRRTNFLRTMLRLARERNALEVVDDQWGVPTSAELIADITAHAILTTRKLPETSGLYHLVPGGETTWCRYAQFALGNARDLGLMLAIEPENIQPISSEAFRTIATRPLNSRLCTRKLTRTFELTLPDWTLGVQRAVCELLER